MCVCALVFILNRCCVIKLWKLSVKHTSNQNYTSISLYPTHTRFRWSLCLSSVFVLPASDESSSWESRDEKKEKKLVKRTPIIIIDSAEEIITKTQVSQCCIDFYGFSKALKNDYFISWIVNQSDLARIPFWLVKIRNRPNKNSQMQYQRAQCWQYIRFESNQMIYFG